MNIIDRMELILLAHVASLDEQIGELEFELDDREFDEGTDTRFFVVSDLVEAQRRRAEYSVKLDAVRRRQFARVAS